MKTLNSIFVLLFMFSLYNLSAQTIKRWTGGKIEMSNKNLQYSIRQNIFSDFNWTKPDIGSRKFSFENGAHEFSWGSEKYTLINSGNDEMKINGKDGLELTSAKSQSKGDIYFDKKALQLKPIMRTRWVSYQTYEMQSVMVPKTRSVTRYQYTNGKSTPVYSTETYYAYEQRSVPKTQWKWETYTEYVIDIPIYDYYSFTMPDNTNLLVYEIKSGNTYYLQNASYISAVDEEGVHHVLTDANTNGNFLDNADRIMFNSWNPYSKESNYKKVKFFRENSWYDLEYLQNENFLTFSLNNNTLSIEYANDRYTESEKKGTVTFSGLPEKSNLFINGKEYNIKGTAKTFKSEYGLFKVRIQRKGFLDFEANYTIDDNTSSVQIKYENTSQAGTFEIKNIFANDYFVSVTNEKNYSRTYSNLNKFNVPEGKNEIAIYTEGFTLNHSVDVQAGQDIELDFEVEVQKLKKSDSEEPENSDKKE